MAARTRRWWACDSATRPSCRCIRSGHAWRNHHVNPSAHCRWACHMYVCTGYRCSRDCRHNQVSRPELVKKWAGEGAWVSSLCLCVVSLLRQALCWQTEGHADGGVCQGYPGSCLVRNLATNFVAPLKLDRKKPAASASPQLILLGASSLIHATL